MAATSAAQRKRVDDSNREVTRLKLLLAEKNRQEAKRNKSAARAKLQKKPSTQNKLIANAESSEDLSSISEEQKYAFEQFDKLAKLLQKQGLDDQKGEYRELVIDAKVDFWIESKRNIQFGYLGHKQYLAVAKLRHGDAFFIVGKKRWRYTIPEQDNDVRYLFLLDESIEGEPQLHYFRKDLLAQ